MGIYIIKDRISRAALLGYFLERGVENAITRQEIKNLIDEMITE